MKKIRITLLSIVTLSCLLINVASVFAATPSAVGKFTKGVSNTTVYIDYGTGANYWQTYITRGASNWESPGWYNPINITFVSSTYGSSIDVYANPGDLWADEGTVVYAETQHFNQGKQINTNYDSDNWTYSEVWINDREFRSPSFTNEDALATLIHEYGHAFGLLHDDYNGYSIMAPGYSRKVYRVQQVDNDAIVQKYS
ncbi:matrixin family metalloprotease [Anaerorhabdus sp.]|uniref:matrixin family metalloprotease n=1 Tax=Anaerorhabdus sp. TaxID=1872524 RepID=UPI002FC6D330